MIELRAHHILRAGNFIRDGTSPADVLEILRQNKYVPQDADARHPFFHVAYRALLDIFDHPDEQVMVLAGTPDFICRACSHPEKPLCFFSGIAYNDMADFPPEFVEGNIYRVSELRERLGF